MVDVRTEAVGAGVDLNYDAIGRLASMAHTFDSGTGNLTLGFPLYNPASQIERRTRNNDSYAWTGGYDVSRSYAVNGLNQYISAGGTSFTYDAKGNLITSGSTTFTYDIENCLVAARGGQTADLRYDPLGRLFEVGTGASARHFLYDGDALVAEYTDAGSLAARFVHGPNPGADDPIVWYGGGENRMLHADHQGSVIAVTYGSGAIRWINGYDEWGIPNLAGNTGRFQYTGQAWIVELGMYHYKARNYSPTLGRFLQTDPVGYDDQINLYAYVGNDPLNRTDPTGMYVCTGNREQCAALRQTLRRLDQAIRSRNLSVSQRNQLSRVRAAHGAERQRNGVVVRFTSQQNIDRAVNYSGAAAYTDYNDRTGESNVYLPDNFPTLYNNFTTQMAAIGRRDPGLARFSPQDERGNIVADEGKHAADQQQLRRDLRRHEWHPPSADLRSIVSRAFGSASVQDINNGNEN